VEAKERLDGYLKLAEYWASRHDGRREFEWKIALAWWGLLALATHYVHSHSLNTMRLCYYLPLSITVALVLLLSSVCLWLFPLWRANMRDGNKAIAAAQSAAAILLNADVQPELQSNEDISFKRFAKDWSMRFQSLTTLVLLTMLCISARLATNPFSS